MLRRTKIVATLGPSTDNLDTLEQLFRAGLDVARVNFSHGNAEDHINRIEMVKQVAEKPGATWQSLRTFRAPRSASPDSGKERSS